MKIYRSNVAALLANSRGQILVCERFKNPNSWQFPQGGVDEGEDLELALQREVEEEVGLAPVEYIVLESRGGFRYEYPARVRHSKSASKRKFVGQEQTYFLCRTKEDYPAIDLMREPREFAQSKWIYPEEFEEAWLPDFKKEVYRAVLKQFFNVELKS
ncbi:MAG: NUDIX domain-containing protein [Akkermansiaceae bacterium]